MKHVEGMTKNNNHAYTESTPHTPRLPARVNGESVSECTGPPCKTVLCVDKNSSWRETRGPDIIHTAELSVRMQSSMLRGSPACARVLFHASTPAKAPTASKEHLQLRVAGMAWNRCVAAICQPLLRRATLKRRTTTMSIHLQRPDVLPNGPMEPLFDRKLSTLASSSNIKKKNHYNESTPPTPILPSFHRSL